jgi:hypothetical protein
MMINTFLIKGSISCMGLVFAGLLFSGCSNNEDDVQPTQDDPVAEIFIDPGTATIPVGEIFEFSVVALDETGDTLNAAEVGIEWEWWSTDTDVFTVEQDGTARCESAGEAFCVVEYQIPFNANNVSETAARMNFTGRDSAFVHVF